MSFSRTCNVQELTIDDLVHDDDDDDDDEGVGSARPLCIPVAL